MINIHHLNCVKISSPLGEAIGHCLLLEDKGKLILIDTGIGLLETQFPEKRLGKELIDITGFEFDVALTAVKQIEKLGFKAEDVTDIVCSHLDPDHIGGLLDFPKARVHITMEEYEAFQKGDERYLPQQMAHEPKLQLYETNDEHWFGLPARKLILDSAIELYLVPLFGHTAGHSGVAVRVAEKWIFYVGDAYYLRAEITDENHPVDQLATIRAVDNKKRLASLAKVREVVKQYGDQLEYFGYHDPLEF